MKTTSATNDLLTALSKFMSDHKCCGLKERLFEEVGQFLGDNMGTSSLIVFSYSQKIHKAKKLDVIRTIWNRDKRNSEFDSISLNQFLEHLEQDENNDIHWNQPIVSRELDDSVHHGFYIGEAKTQVYFGVVKEVEKTKFNHDIFNILTKFVSNAFVNIQMWHDVNHANFLVHIDDVTGLYNQRRLQKDLEHVVERHAKYNEEFVVFFIDIDHFKEVNDNHGHLTGTRLLAELATMLKEALRESDLIYRYGGDEFVMIIPNVEPSMAYRMAQRILDQVKGSVFVISEKERFQISVSIGVAHFPEDAKTVDDILICADKMMYHAKAEGRGRVSASYELFLKKSS
ncbi:MAG: GGDEF domain-containing protein [Bacteriovoracaceae bacterium]|nr:GGDEF domain-containing protein [Bacteriovoracaceae bacterium]